MDKANFYNQEQMDREKENIMKVFRDFCKVSILVAIVSAYVIVSIFYKTYSLIFTILLLFLIFICRKNANITDFFYNNLGKFFESNPFSILISIMFVFNQAERHIWYMKENGLLFASKYEFFSIETKIIVFVIACIIPLILNKKNIANLYMSIIMYILTFSLMPLRKIYDGLLSSNFIFRDVANIILDKYDIFFTSTFIGTMMATLFILIFSYAKNFIVLKNKIATSIGVIWGDEFSIESGKFFIDRIDKTERFNGYEKETLSKDEIKDIIKNNINVQIALANFYMINKEGNYTENASMVSAGVLNSNVTEEIELFKKVFESFSLLTLYSKKQFYKIRKISPYVFDIFLELVEKDEINKYLKHFTMRDFKDDCIDFIYQKSKYKSDIKTEIDIETIKNDPFFEYLLDKNINNYDGKIMVSGFTMDEIKQDETVYALSKMVKSLYVEVIDGNKFLDWERIEK